MSVYNFFMKTIDEIIKRTAQEKLKEISAIMEIRGTSEQKLRESYNSIFCLFRLIKTLNRDELAILKLLYSGNDGISFNDIQKSLGIDIDSIETATTNLCALMLAYVIKNRQMLNKKMDKLYCINEVSTTLTISTVQDIIEHLHKTEEAWTEQKQEAQQPRIDEKLKSIIKKIISRGGLIPAEDLAEELQSGDVEQRAAEACKTGLFTAFNIMGDRLSTYIAINPSLVSLNFSAGKKAAATQGITVNNGYNLAINLLLAYDVISSSGLFLTKQNKFRKIDLKKISDSMLVLKSIKGEAIQGEDNAMLILQLLNIMNCLKLDRDIGVISLKPVAEYIDDPVLLLKHLATKMTDIKKKDDIFAGEIPIPDHHDLKTALSLVARIRSAESGYVRNAFMTARAISIIRKNGVLSAEQVASDEKSFESCLEFLTISGLTGVSEGLIVLTEHGKRLHSALFGKKYTKESEAVKCVYISPDFTLMIPDKDIDPSSLYLIMAYTEIIRQDVVIEAAITKSSIINASKRGMNFDRFITTLRKYAKNDIPQNLEFLLDDWTKQTISINISRPVLLYSSHPSYIDELLYSPTSKAVKERISENYVILDRDYIDDIVRFSKKYDVKLNIFEDEN